MAVRELREEDVDRAVEVLTHAFAEDPALIWLLPDPVHRAKVQPLLARAYCAYAMEYGVAWCTDDVSGVALRRPPGAEHLSWIGMVRSGMLLLPLHLGWAATARMIEVEEKTSAWHTESVEGDHWYLWTVAVDPAHQGEGLGGELMRHTFEAADQRQLPCYLETTHPKARNLHEYNGFRVIREAAIGGELRVWAMVRPPSGGEARLQA